MMVSEDRQQDIIMQYLKNSPAHKRLGKLRAKRNHLVCQFLDADPFLSRKAAFKKANRVMGKQPK